MSNSRPQDLQNWALRNYESLGPHCRFDTGNPEYGYGGGTIWALIGEKNNTTSYVGVTEDGQFNLFNDGCVSLTGGVTKNGGACVNIVGKNGDVTVTAMRNGDVKIKGKNIIVDADDSLRLESKKNVVIKGSNSIFLDTPTLNTNAMNGNLAPRDVTFGGLVFRGSKVGKGVIDSAFTGGSLGSISDKLKAQAPSIKDKMSDIAGNIDTGAISDQLSSIDTSGLSNALSNFGGFG